MSISTVIVAYGGSDDLLRCVRSVRETEPAAEVVVVENGALSPAVAAAAERDGFELVLPGRNLGFGGGCNLGARHARGDVLAFLNPDTVAMPGALAALARALDEDDGSVGVATARLRLLEEPHLLNSGGNVLHLSGLAWVGGYRRSVETANEPRDVPFPTGAAMAIRRDLFDELGGFREELFMYHEDVDLGWRVWLRGLRVVMTPAADVLHAYSFGRNPQKHYLLERNRLSFLLCDLPGRLLLVLAPVLAAAEVALTLLAWREGWLRDKARGWLWCARHARALARRRRETQATRRAAARDLARLLTPTIDPAVIEIPAAARAANPLLAAYWSLARRLL